MALEPITRAEQIMSGKNLEPITREEMFLAKAGGQDVQTPTPITRKEMFLQAVVDNAGGGGADHTAEDGLIMGTLTEYTNNRVESIRERAFYQVTNLVSVNFPEVLTVGGYAFYKCSNLESVTIPKVKALSSSAFSNTKIKKFTSNTLESLGNASFAGCKELEEVDLPLVTLVENNCFGSCPKLATINLPSVTDIYEMGFVSCTNILSADFPLVTKIGKTAFKGCTSLKHINLPLCGDSIQDSAFGNCTSLESVILGDVLRIYSGSFSNCTALKTLVLRKSSSIVNLASTGAFTGTPFAAGGTGGTVYVPAALIESYQAATNWSTLYAGGTCNFVAIEGSEYE